MQIERKCDFVNKDLLNNLNKLHTTELGTLRIKKNLDLQDEDVVAWCKNKIKNAKDIVRRGKNWYAHVNGAIITVNAHSFTIINAHKPTKKV